MQEAKAAIELSEALTEENNVLREVLASLQAEVGHERVCTGRKFYLSARVHLSSGRGTAPPCRLHLCETPDKTPSTWFAKAPLGPDNKQQLKLFTLNIPTHLHYILRCPS
jgi:hypothetical protein